MEQKTIRTILIIAVIFFVAFAANNKGRQASPTDGICTPSLYGCMSMDPEIAELEYDECVSLEYSCTKVELGTKTQVCCEKDGVSVAPNVMDQKTVTKSGTNTGYITKGSVLGKYSFSYGADYISAAVEFLNYDDTAKDGIVSLEISDRERKGFGAQIQCGEEDDVQMVYHLEPGESAPATLKSTGLKAGTYIAQLFTISECYDVSEPDKERALDPWNYNNINTVPSTVVTLEGKKKEPFTFPKIKLPEVSSTFLWVGSAVILLILLVWAYSKKPE